MINFSDISVLWDTVISLLRLEVNTFNIKTYSGPWQTGIMANLRDIFILHILFNYFEMVFLRL